MIDVEHDSIAMSFMESKGHRTVPQLYYNEVDIQRGNSTELTKTIISDRIERVQWPTIDSGIE
jgi:glutaredoxin